MPLYPPDPNAVTGMPASLGLPPPGMGMPAPGMPMPGMGDPSMLGMGDPMLGQPDPLAMMSPIAPPPPEEELAPVQVGPDLADKPWYRTPSRPNKDDVQAEAEQEKLAHDQRIAISVEMQRRLSVPGEVFGYFKKDEEAIVANEVEPFPDLALRAEHDLACAHIASMDVGIDALYRETIDKEEAAAKEDLAAYLFECEQRQHARAGNGSIKWAWADILQKHGMLVGFDAIDPGDTECGLRMRMIDPATVFPIHEGPRGLAQLYRVYNATASSVIGDFSDGTGAVERKVKQIAKFQSHRYDPSFMGEVIEYWDRNWFLVLFDGEQIVLREHHYARVPFTVTYGCFGQQGFTRTSNYFFVDRNTAIQARAGQASARMRAEDLARQAQPFLYWRTRAHDFNEAFKGLLATAVRRSVNPPVVHKRSIAASMALGRLKLDRTEGGYTAIGETEAVEPIATIPAPEILAPMATYIEQNRAIATPAGVLNGQLPGSQTSGSALDISATMGYERWNPLILVIQEFLTQRTEARLELLRDWGEILGQGENLGQVNVPRRKPNPRTGNAAAHVVTPDMLRQTGIRVAVELRRFNPSTLSQVANGLMILQNMGIIDKRRLIKIAGFDPDPDAVLQAVDFDQLWDVPEVKQEKTLRLLARLRDQALMREDYESAIDLEQALYFIGSEMERRAMIGQPALGPTGQRINGQPGQNNSGMNQGTIGVQGMSMPMMGIPTGTNGGRPPGS